MRVGGEIQVRVFTRSVERVNMCFGLTWATFFSYETPWLQFYDEQIYEKVA